ncbi:hypothetical protein BL14DL4_00018 [Bacillus licheniformis]|uniref:hypothetical protein n=1 Tax=Bacillus licheniformis TaxID=1402 RepID=UPI000D222CE4|nr:hypothetical protein [Bacillus licheniformis]AVI45287.1 hypothetical protein BL14DL4_00018 [Bacillus licheniformis]
MEIDLDAMGYDELIEHGEAVMRAIRLRSYGEGYKQGKFDAVMDATHSPEKEELPYEFSDEDIELAIKEARRYLAQERRDEIVEQAKADVSDLINRDIGHDHEFIVNTEKRTVVVLRKLRGCTNIVRRGIAKAAPDDCFNVHIGEAIALHRALGLEVPDEYLNAPQPTEVRVGDIVMHTVTSEIAPVISDDDWPPLTGDYVYHKDVEAARRYALIIDDSRTEAI